VANSGEGLRIFEKGVTTPHNTHDNKTDTTKRSKTSSVHKGRKRGQDKTGHDVFLNA
jgi:hypothetical protein